MARSTRGLKYSFEEPDDDDDELYKPRARSRAKPRRKSTRTVKTTLNKSEKEIALILVGLSQEKIYTFITERDRRRKAEAAKAKRPTKKPKTEDTKPSQTLTVPVIEQQVPPTFQQNPLINVNPFSPQCAFSRAAKHACLAFYVYRKQRNEPVSTPPSIPGTAPNVLAQPGPWSQSFPPLSQGMQFSQPPMYPPMQMGGWPHYSYSS
ncbi:hypothetical protein P9112_011394 [Eukaryota sp. TZLM1-RC]